MRLSLADRFSTPAKVALAGVLAAGVVTTGALTTGTTAEAYLGRQSPWSVMGPCAQSSQLYWGSKGACVGALQMALNTPGCGNYRLAVDGVFGRDTYLAVRHFQSRRPSLTVDGVAGRQTWKYIQVCA